MTTASDLIEYNRLFAEKVIRGPGAEVGKLQARFRPGPTTDVLYQDDEEGLRHYLVELTLHSPAASKIDTVEYHLDDTFYDPLRLSEDADTDFAVELLTYGNVEVEVIVRMGSHKYIQRAWLGRLLRNGHANNLTPTIEAAIKQIEAN
jgi:hypothetical protein